MTAFQLLSNPADRPGWDRAHAKPVPEGSQPGEAAIAPETQVVYVDYDRYKPGCAHARWLGRAS